MRNRGSIVSAFRAIAIAFAFIVIFARCSQAGGVKNARVTGMGGAGVTLDGFWAVLGNQAGLAGEQELSIGLSATNRFMLRETTQAAVALTIPLRNYVFAVSCQQAGHSLYRDMAAGVALARSFGQRIEVGLQLDYRSVRLSGPYGHSAGVTFQAGIRMMVTEVLLLAVHTSNPLASRHMRNEGEGPQGHWSVGLLYRFGSKVIVNLEVNKEFLFKPVVRGGLEYGLDPLVIIRAGFSSLPVAAGSTAISNVSVISFGYGLTTGRFRIDLGAGIHSVAGAAPAVSVQYVIGSNK